MVQILTDRRAITAIPDPQGERLFAELASQFARLRFELARLALRLSGKGTHHLSGSSSIVEYARRSGLSEVEARMLLPLARALGEDPRLEEKILAGRLPLESAVLVGELLLSPGAIRKGEDWFQRAEILRPRELRRAVKERLEEIAQGTCPLVSVTLHITEGAREEFHRARVLVCREARLTVTEGQAFTRIVRFFLEEKDPLRRSPGKRRVGPTASLPGSRYIPAAVSRAVLARSMDRCEVAGCTHGIHLDFAHVSPHAKGSAREEKDLLRLCSQHHTQFDADWLLLARWERHGELERPVFVTARGVELTWGARPPEQKARTDDQAAIARRKSYGEQVSERPPPAWGRSA